MYLKVNSKSKYDVVELTGFWEKFRGLKFYLDRFDYVIKFKNKKFISTAFLCQKIDIIMTDKDDKVLYLYKNVKSERYFLPKLKAKDTYFLPVGTAENYKIGDKLVFKEK